MDTTIHRLRGRDQFLTEQQLSRIHESELARFEELAERMPVPVVASHTSALKLLGVELPERYLGPFAPDSLHIVVGSPKALRKVDGVTMHVNNARLVEEHSAPCGGDFGMVTAELALMQMAETLDMLELVVLGDCMMRRGVQKQTTKRQLALTMNQAGTFRGKRKLMRAIPLMRENTDSSYETRTRLLLACRGLGSADVNAEVSSDRATPWHVDMAYPELMVAIEYDGLFHMTDVIQQEQDKQKRGHLRSRSWEMFEITKMRLATPEARDAVADDVAHAFGRALDMPIRPLPCIPIRQLADRRSRYRAAGLELPQLERFFINPPE
ncbi:hypothetical protein JS533_011055 [Bifidobacterium amazonense]|uniref:DUF559 domain-containing protein n=1 Tax=Bifidobacterium amazonense TaxID=2809027 RepID=A0ABS9VXH0_9BIFI|nr:hypothetical protein [Bifidobacterium amazonense]MCH9276805.1 hypothetical protein [Bifidobacterium amazonense]